MSSARSAVAPCSETQTYSTRDTESSFITGTAIVLYLALAKLLLHLYAAHNYGYFVDELYFIACSDHLAWGYVDQPPLIALIVKIARVLFGDSLQSIRFFAGLAGAATVLLTGKIARELGGGRFAQGFAALCVLVAPVYLGMNHYISMNAFEPLIWMTCAYLLIRIIKTDQQRLWLWFGFVAGIGLNNKHSMGFFGLGVVIGLLLTEHRRMFLKPYIWLGGLIAAALIAPNVIWNVQHHFPFRELMANIARSGRNTPLSHSQFLIQQAILLLPLTAPVWIAGLWYLLFGRGKTFRVLAWSYLVVLATMFMPNARPYYIAPAYPMLLAAGAIAIEQWFTNRLRWVKSTYAVTLAILGGIAAPMLLPVLPVNAYIRYSQALHIAPPPIETHKLGPLPQFYADMYGWEGMTAVVAKAYNRLPPDERLKTAIFANNFGQAGAIDLFGKKYGLPKAISGHQTYFFWGPRNYTGESVIVMGVRPEELRPFFASVEPVGTVYNPYSMPYEHFDIYHCRGLKVPMQKAWPGMKNWN